VNDTTIRKELERVADMDARIENAAETILSLSITDMCFSATTSGAVTPG
jgi:hypothetical protein